MEVFDVFDDLLQAGGDGKAVAVGIVAVKSEIGRASCRERV